MLVIYLSKVYENHTANLRSHSPLQFFTRSVRSATFLTSFGEFSNGRFTMIAQFISIAREETPRITERAR